MKFIKGIKSILFLLVLVFNNMFFGASINLTYNALKKLAPEVSVKSINVDKDGVTVLIFENIETLNTVAEIAKSAGYKVKIKNNKLTLVPTSDILLDVGAKILEIKDALHEIDIRNTLWPKGEKAYSFVIANEDMENAKQVIENIPEYFEIKIL